MDEKLVKKIEKLLNLGNGSCYAGEAESALKMAYDLMQENNISMEDVGKVSRDEKLGELGESNISEEEKQWRKWEMNLLASIAKLFDCQVLRTGYKSAYYKKANLSIIGRESNRITAKLMYDWIHDKTAKEAKYLDPYRPSGRNAYCMGVSCAISNRVNEMKKTQKADGWGIVPIDEVKQWMQANIENMKNTQLTANNVKDAMAYQQGKATGNNISLNRQFGLTGIEAK